MFLLEISLWCGELDVSLFGVFSQVSLSILHIVMCFKLRNILKQTNLFSQAY